MFLDDWDPRDGNQPQPRVMNINGCKNVFKNPADNYHFRLTESVSSDAVYDITPWWKLPPLPLVCGGKIVFDAGRPMRAELRDADGKIFSSGETDDGKIALPCPADGFVRLRCYRQLSDGVRGYSEASSYCCDALLALIEKNLAPDASPRDRVRALGLLSAVERVKAELTVNATGISEAAQEELR
ncbi:hypothetical protein SDC9_200601 [bioreactor metagenome]|uniref:Uncharacterized protein n=1 Tax=bioreactor metagenome TaxID=1076179 RepID=A0A645INN6_9ZZZZ